MHSSAEFHRLATCTHRTRHPDACFRRHAHAQGDYTADSAPRRFALLGQPPKLNDALRSTLGDTPLLDLLVEQKALNPAERAPEWYNQDEHFETAVKEVMEAKVSVIEGKGKATEARAVGFSSQQLKGTMPNVSMSYSV